MKTTILLFFTVLFGLSLQAQDYKGKVSKTAEEQLNESYCSGLFKTTDGQILDLSTDASVKAYINILDWMQGRIAGYQVYKNHYGTSIPILRGGVPGVFIDEVQVSPSALSTININDISIVKVIKTPFYGGFNAGNGAIAVYTKLEEEEK